MIDGTPQKESKMSKNLVFITTDLQYDLVKKSPIREQRVYEMLPKLIEFLNELRKRNILIIHQQLIYKDTDHVEIMNGKIPCLEGSEGVKFLKEIDADKDMVIPKRKDSGFYETNLQEILKEHDIDTVMLSGMQAQICIQTTGADAYFRGYNVIAVSDCITSTLEEDKKRALDWIQGYCGKVMSSDEITISLRDGVPIEFPVIYTP
jgi:nicotinamidase-related amidase